MAENKQAKAAPTGDIPITEGQSLADMYRFAEACERALLRYEVSILETSPEEYRALMANKKLSFDLSRLFFGATTQAELDSYMDKTPAELAEIIAQNDKRYYERNNKQ